MTTPPHALRVVGRAWLIAVGACVALFALWGVIMTAVVGQWASVTHNVLDTTLAFGGIFAVVTAVIHVPLFGWLRSQKPEVVTPTLGLSVGAALTPVITITIAWMFRESGDPQTIGAFVAQWLVQLPMAFLGMPPVLVASTLLGRLCATAVPARP